MSCQQSCPVAVNVPLRCAVVTRTSGELQPGVFLHWPGPSGVDTHTVTSVGCEDGAQDLMWMVDFTALAPPGSSTSCGADTL